MSPRRFLGAFAAAYLLSYLFRSVNAVVSPELTRELALEPGSLGLLTGAYLVAFASVQVPAGMLLDRFGPRRVEPVLLMLAGAGSLLFSLAGNVATLAVGRALIGAGVAVCLMGPLKAIAAWTPRERHASLGAWMMVAGAIGALAATAPTELALRYVPWRTLFVGLGVATFAAAAWIWLRVPDTAKPDATRGFKAQWAGVRDVFAHPRFWWMAPLGATVMGAYFSIQGLWSVPWLIEVSGYDRAIAARHLFVMGLVTLIGYLAMGLFATRIARHGIAPRHLFAFGFALNVAAFAAIVCELPGTYLWWALYGLGAATNVLAFGVLNEGFPIDFVGRANTALNLMMFGGGFIAQWGIGLIVDAARNTLGVGIADGLRIAFAIALVLTVAAYAWFARGWRRHSVQSAGVAQT